MGQMNSKKAPGISEKKISVKLLDPTEASSADGKQGDRTIVEDEAIIAGEQPPAPSSTDELSVLKAIIFSDSIKFELPSLHIEKMSFIANIKASALNLNKIPLIMDFGAPERSTDLLRKSTLATSTNWRDTLPLFQMTRKTYPSPVILEQNNQPMSFLSPNEYTDIILVALGQALIKYTLAKDYATSLSRYRDRFPVENNAFLNALGFFVIAYFHQTSTRSYIEIAYNDYAKTIYTSLLQIICLKPLPTINCHISASDFLPETDNKHIRHLLAEVNEEVTEKIRDNQQTEVKKCIDYLLMPLTLGVKASKLVFPAHAIAKLKNIPLSDLHGDNNFFISELNKLDDQYKQYISSRARAGVS